MGDAERKRLNRLLGDPELQWLVARVRRRLELGRPLKGNVTLSDASTAQRQALERLLGRRPRSGGAVTVSLGAVDEVLRRSGVCPEGLAAAVVLLSGPVTVRANASTAEQMAWARAFAPLEDVIGRRVELADWLRGLQGSGMVKRLEPDPARARPLLQQLAAVVTALPAEGEPLGSFAARVAGGAHALDSGKPLATLALGAARAMAGLAPPGPDESPAESRREAWAAAGLLCDELSSTVLTLGLHGERRTSCGQMLGVARASGEPVLLTLRQLVRDPPRWAADARNALAGMKVRVCENPVLVALAADRLGTRCTPLVCTGGQPGAATMLLLRALIGAGARLFHHGDFDWGGVRIGNVLHARLPFVPWQFDTDAYTRASATAASSPLTGTPVSASWDSRLAETMHRTGLRIEEEVVLEDLLADLAS